MKRTRWNAVRLPIAAIAISLLGMNVPANAEPRRDKHNHREDRLQQKALKHHQQHERHDRKQEERAEKKRDHREEKAQHHEEQREQQRQRLSAKQQEHLVKQQRQRLAHYRAHLEEQRRLVHQQSVRLQQEKRMAQYRFQQQYLERLHQQQIRIASEREHDYRNDPYFHTPPSHRYLRGGRYYETNRYGAELLQRGVSYGYEEGFRAGEADREDRWASDYRNSSVYQDANYGYDGYYVDRDDYNHYFREGFSRGYEDGYDSRHQYGSSSDGKNSILGTVLAGILNLESLR